MANEQPIRVALALVVMLPLVWLMMSAEEAHACSCGPLDLEKFEMIFQGKVIGSKVIEQRGLYNHLTLFDVETVWKGPLRETVRLHYGGCPAGLELGDTYRVFAYERDGLLWAEYCSVEYVAEKDGLASLDLGEGESPPLSLKSRVLYAVIAFSVAGLVGMAWLGWRKRRVG